MPLKSALLSSNNQTEYKKELRSESEINPNIQTTLDSKILSHTDTQAVRPIESGTVLFTIYIL